MLDKLNKAADLIAELISSHPDNKKKKKALEGSPEEEAQEDPAAEAAEGDDKASRAQRSIRKNMGGLKEPK